MEINNQATVSFGITGHADLHSTWMNLYHYTFFGNLLNEFVLYERMTTVE